VTGSDLLVWRADTAAEDRVELESGGVGGVSDRGRRHRRNEDAMALAVLARPAAVVAVVCDGVSSSEHPERASLAAARAAATVFVEELPGRDGDAATRAAVTAAARAAAAQAGPEAARAPACTYASAVVTADAVTVGWVGDSRVYWLSDTSSRRLTTDDSWTAEMVGAGLLTEQDARHHPKASVITRWLGVNAGQVDPHVVTVEPEGPGVILVCSDGLWHYLDDAEAMAAAALPLAHEDPLAAARALTAIALDGGGHDNITVAVAPFPPRGLSPDRGTPVEA
jgi:serine/threonine protein phosphatase PrpC